MIDIKPFVKPDVRADVANKIDGCPFRHILPYLAPNGGEITGILVADNGLDLADLGAVCVDPAIQGPELERALIKLREGGQIKQIIFGPINPAAQRFGWSLSQIADDEGIDAFYAPPFYVIKFRGYKWR